VEGKARKESGPLCLFGIPQCNSLIPTFQYKPAVLSKSI
jgi:hypothetical protein